MFTINRVNSAWVAGMYEGEGCISIQRGKNYCYPKIEISSNDLDVLQKIYLIVGYGSIRIAKNAMGNWRESYRYAIYDSQLVWDFVDTIYEWLGERRKEQIKIATQLCYVPPQRCIECNSEFQPGVDRKRGATTCSDECMMDRRRKLQRQYHHDKAIARRSDERAARD